MRCVHQKRPKFISVQNQCVIDGQPINYVVDDFSALLTMARQQDSQISTFGQNERGLFATTRIAAIVNVYSLFTPNLQYLLCRSTFFPDFFHNFFFFFYFFFGIANRLRSKTY